MAKVKNKKKAFKHRLKKQGLFNNLKAPVPPVPPVAPPEETEFLDTSLHTAPS